MSASARGESSSSSSKVPAPARARRGRKGRSAVSAGRWGVLRAAAALSLTRVALGEEGGEVKEALDGRRDRRELKLRAVGRPSLGLLEDRAACTRAARARRARTTRTRRAQRVEPRECGRRVGGVHAVWPAGQRCGRRTRHGGADEHARRAQPEPPKIKG
eukprot:822515-Prymnesium_polylepis.1